ncbi:MULTISPECIES: Flp pilus assembly protein ATPase CpaE [Sphingomonas]|jgi:pilus assembly protein CpaE|uniref:Pilus assembly protein CpaE n=3 Tax=Sphingomonas TaxID=13687 RepID=A0A0D1MNY2_9SPHN|nr:MULTISPECIES: Flp pilus assembly protein ATPase CpaE [Sphingomonas]ANC86387.1 pilus assembly protein CpaE [Sphingomonas sp. NIC1]AOW22317.1 pilus assembly protein CpaE [Sphingomonas melonis TY]ATI55698.1 pilus assembly protein CpaE [Sphingomonas melonis]KIU29111.1 pilus assembly protein CpaE [Sphingomonas melonis]KZB95990.1 pilus assembly protein CpaE [Sphingomonas melonis TY]
MNAPWKPAGIVSRDPFAAYVCDEASAEALRPIAGDMGWSIDKVYKGGLRNAVQSLSVSASPQILFVDLAESGDPLNDINALAEVCEPGTVVIAAGQVNDVRLYRDLIASGIQDYLLKPLQPDALRESLGHAHAMLNAPKPIEASLDRPHSAIAVIGTRGGVGASTIATSLAWLVSDKEKRTTALLDLDVHFGTGALTLDLEPGRGLTDAIENPSRIDGLFIERAMVKASEKLAVLSAEAPINTPLMTDGTAFLQLQEEMRAAFEATVVDLPRSMLILYPHLIRDTQSMVVVTELTLAAARDTIRLLSWLKANAPQTQVTVVANRVHAAGQLEISRKDFEGSIERKIDFLIPFDQKLAAQAAKLGKPLAEAGKNSRTIAPIIALTRHVLNAADDMVVGDDDGGTGKPKSKSLLGGMSAMLSKRSKK